MCIWGKVFLYKCGVASPDAVILEIHYSLFTVQPIISRVGNSIIGFLIESIVFSKDQLDHENDQIIPADLF